MADPLARARASTTPRVDYTQSYSPRLATGLAVEARGENPQLSDAAPPPEGLQGEDSDGIDVVKMPGGPGVYNIPGYSLATGGDGSQKSGGYSISSPLVNLNVAAIYGDINANDGVSSDYSLATAGEGVGDDETGDASTDYGLGSFFFSTDQFGEVLSGDPDALSNYMSLNQQAAALDQDASNLSDAYSSLLAQAGDLDAQSGSLAAQAGDLTSQYSSLLQQSGDYQAQSSTDLGDYDTSLSQYAASQGQLGQTQGILAQLNSNLADLTSSSATLPPISSSVDVSDSLSIQAQPISDVSVVSLGDTPVLTVPDTAVGLQSVYSAYGNQEPNNDEGEANTSNTVGQPQTSGNVYVLPRVTVSGTTGQATTDVSTQSPGTDDYFGGDSNAGPKIYDPGAPKPWLQSQYDEQQRINQLNAFQQANGNKVASLFVAPAISGIAAPAIGLSIGALATVAPTAAAVVTGSLIGAGGTYGGINLYQGVKTGNTYQAVMGGLTLAGSALGLVGAFATGEVAVGYEPAGALGGGDESVGVPNSADELLTNPQNIANAPRLSQQLTLQSAESSFNADGTLTQDAIDNSSLIISPNNLSNPAIPGGYGKYSTQTFQSPYGNFQTHFYMNADTGDVYYGLDYKSVFNSMSGVPQR